MRLVIGFPIVFVTFAATSPLVSCGGGVAPSSHEPPQVATVSTEVLKRGQVTETLETLGRIDLDPKQTRTVAMVASGQVRRVLVTPGQRIAAGTELLDLGPLPGDSLEVLNARIDLEYAKQELARLQRMRDNHLATNEQVAQAKKAVASASATLEAMGAAASNGRERSVLAPFAGIVRDVLVTAGAIVHAGEPAALLAPAGAIIVRAGFEPEDLGRLDTGLPATVVPVLYSEGQKPVPGVLAELHQVVDPDTQLVEAVVHPATAPSWMLPGTTVRVTLVVNSAPDAVLVPRDALLARNGARGVFVVESGHAHWTPIDVGLEDRDVVEARSGVTPGSRVVTTGRSVLSDGMAVTEGEPSS